MGWQDRDYARGDYGLGSRARFPRRVSSRSLVITLIVVNVVVFLLSSGSGRLARLLLDVGVMQGRAVLHGQVWRLFTAQYMHASTNHLLFNMLGLYFLGRPLEQMWGARKFFIVYTVAGLAGNVFYTLLCVVGWLNPLGLLLGASGCILGLLGICAVLFPRAEILLFFILPMKIRTAAMLFGGLYVLNLLQKGSNAGGDACHLAGLAFGVWWAMAGERWWARRRWSWASLTRASTPRRPPRGRGAFRARIKQRRADAETVDRILAKVYEGGIHTLSDAEKRALAEATQRQREEQERLDGATRR